MAEAIIVPKEDIAEVCKMGELFAADVPAMKDYDTTLATLNVQMSVEQEIGRLYGLVQDGEYVGFLYALMFPDFFTGRMTAQEMAWYVKKEHRRNGLKLIRKFEDDCVKAGVKRIVMCQLVESMPEKIERLYTRLGYVKQDILYRKDI